MAKKKEKKPEEMKILVMACDGLFDAINNTGAGNELDSVTLLPPTVKETLKAFTDGDIDYTSFDPQNPEDSYDCVYEVTIKKIGTVKNDVHLG